MGLKAILGKFFNKYLFNAEWKCLSCGAEIFGDKAFCEKCYNELPFNDGYICQHCGRKVIAAENYCSTCKGKLLSMDKGRSVFNYDKPISTMIKQLKYYNKRYLVDYFAKELSLCYLKNYFNADYITYVPMTKRSKAKRGYNQSQLLAKALSERVGVPLYDGLIKVKETKRQATLNRAQRLENLKQAFKVEDKKLLKEKTVVLVDDVTTTGSTAEVICERLKKAGATNVYLLTVASLPPIDKY